MCQSGCGKLETSCVSGGNVKWFSHFGKLSDSFTQRLKIKLPHVSRSAVSNSLRPHGLEPTRLLCPWDSPGKNIGVVAIPFSRGFSWPRDQTQVSCIAGGFFIIWATREVQTRAFNCQARFSRVLFPSVIETNNIWCITYYVSLGPWVTTMS